MYTLAAKLAWGVLQPSNLIAILAVLGLLAAICRWKALSAKLWWGAAVLLLIFGVLPTGQILIAPLEDRFPQPDATAVASAHGIIVLAGPEKPTLTFIRRQPILGDSGNRVIAGIDLAHRFPKKPMIHTGGAPDKDSGLSQAEVAAMVFKAADLPDDRVILEKGSKDTHGNAKLTHALINPAKGEQWILVTSAYHMPRSVATFRSAGWSVLPYPVDYRSSGVDGKLSWQLEVANSLRESDLAVHEWIGLIAYRLLGRSKELYPAP